VGETVELVKGMGGATASSDRVVFARISRYAPRASASSLRHDFPNWGEEVGLKRFAIAAVLVAALALGAGPAVAGGGGATVDTSSVSFVITSATCSNLPPGTTVTGTGTETSITVVKTKDGVTRIHNTSHARGTATDQDGNTYVFNYSNSFNVSDSATSPGVFSGIMNDHFSLAGNGPANLNNGFQAVFTTDFTSFATFDPLKSFGDPLDFAAGLAHCDPL
jgi:hypothetical protein